MRVILDTNVLLGALISPHGAPHLIYQAWRKGRFELLTSTTQLDELRRASRYPKLRNLLPAHRAGAMINNLQRTTVLTSLPPLASEITLADPDDAFLLAMALVGEADYLVTGDKRAGLLQRDHFGRTRIVSPGRFCDEML